MDELAVVQPHGPDRLLISSTRRRSSAVIAVTGRTRPDDSGALSVLVRDGGTLINVVTADQASAAPPARSRRFRLLTVRADEQPFPRAWNEAVLRWQRSGNRPSSRSAARA